MAIIHEESTNFFFTYTGRAARDNTLAAELDVVMYGTYDHPVTDNHTKLEALVHAALESKADVLVTSCRGEELKFILEELKRAQQTKVRLLWT